MQILDVNAHLHTPYSFSAFKDVPQALDMAEREGVKVVGINDFYSMDGYDQWSQGCAERHLFPLFNIEFISLNVDDQSAGIRVNDPNNPGRTYLSGKGMSYPVRLLGHSAEQLASVRAESNDQIRRMCDKLNAHLDSIEAGFCIDFNRIEKKLACGLIRERHLAKALRLAVEENVKNDAEAFYLRLFGGKQLKSELDDTASLENEIRGNLLKSGGTSFVPEDPSAFLPMQDVIGIIKSAGGIPTYPFLADDAHGNFTDFEADLQKCADILKRRGIRSAEFITTRNTTETLERYATYLVDEGFIVTFGSEHNTPTLEPVLLRTRDNGQLSDKLRGINYRGACMVAAHQSGFDSFDKGEEIITKATI